MATKPLSDLTATWNAAGTTFTAVKMNVTDTASAAGSALIDLQVAGVSQFKVSKAGAVTAVGVAVPTISSSDTLSNKTLSSPTLSGTVAGAVTFSGNLTFTSATSITISTTEPRQDFYETDAGANAKRWSFIVDTNIFYLQTRTDADVFGAIALSITRSGTTVTDINFGAGITVGSPTGGNKGAGTINATAVYDDDVLLTCYVLEHWIDGAINIDGWNARVPNRELPAVISGDQEIEPARTEIRQHLPAQGFARVAEARLDIDQFRQFLIDNRRLPAFPGPDRWADVFNGKMSTGDVLQRLWETVEVLAVHACKARERELALEARIAALENRT